MSRLILKNFRIVDETTDARGSVIVEDGIIRDVCIGKEVNAAGPADIVLDGGCMEQSGLACGGGLACSSSLALMPAFVDLHAHFREPGFSEKETLESACLAAAAGGYGTVVCMANTKPVTDTIAQVRSIKSRTDALGLVDVYPVLSLTKGMEGTELSEIALAAENQETDLRLLSEDGKDVADDGVFLAAMERARRWGIPVSCHCDLDGENNAVRRVLELGKKAGHDCMPECRLHIAHVSTREAAAMIREAKNNSPLLTCEVTPHHIALTEKDAAALGSTTLGRVNPPLRTEEDRQALIAAIVDGTVDAIATDHAPHTQADKEKGAPGFTGLETAFAVCYSTLVVPGHIGLSKLSSLMSAAPARILGLDGDGRSAHGRGRIAPGLRADFAIADLGAAWTVAPENFMSRGKNSPFAGRTLTGKIVLTVRGGRIVYCGISGLGPY